jgi:TetR/AcrR family transcriptional repressor of bet genes
MPKIVDHDEQRRQIAGAAIAVIDAGGLEGARLRDVAEAADVTTGAVTHYFDGKDAVLEAALAEIVRRILEKQGGPPPRSAETFCDMAAGFLPIDAESRREWRVWLAFWGRAIVDDALRAQHRAYYAAIVDRLVADFRAPDARGRAMAPCAARMLADATIAAIDGIGTRATLEPDDWPPRRQRETLRAMLLPLVAEIFA